MAPATKTPVEDPLERELHELEDEEERLEARTSNVERLNLVTLLLALVAFGAAMIAIVLAVSNNDNRSTGPVMHSRSSSSAMPGGGMMGSRTGGGGGAPAGVHTVDVKLGEMWVRPQYTSVEAGKITFVARNVGQVEHELMVERAPIAMDAPGKPNEEAAQGMIEDMEPGQGGQMTVKLKPGSYVLFCNVTGHYAAGQHVPFTVTSG